MNGCAIDYTGQKMTSRSPLRQFVIPILMAIAVCTTPLNPANAQSSSLESQLVIPASSIGSNGSAPRAHSNISVVVPSSRLAINEAPAAQGPPYPGYSAETPASLACVYNLVPASPQSTGCNPSVVTMVPAPQKSTLAMIAVVVACHDPTVAKDLEKFSKQFGLAAPLDLTVSNTSTNLPDSCTGEERQGWNEEASRDIEYVHAMAPAAALYLVEAQSSALDDLLAAVQIANSLVRRYNTGIVVNPWGIAESSRELADDFYFSSTPGVIYLAAAGDVQGVVQYPATSPYVIAVGGTSLSRDPETGFYLLESAANDGQGDATGGGPSQFEPIPAYQQTYANIAGTHRVVPDVSAIGDVGHGVWVYSGVDNGWIVTGGTGLSTTLWAAITADAGSFYGKTDASAFELQQIYRGVGSTSHFNLITTGTCGPYNGYIATGEYNMCTGLGSPNGYSGK